MENFTLDNSTYVEDNISLNSNLNQTIKTVDENGNKKKLSNILNEYRLTQNNFNPNKKTPPNVFLNKLQQRMNFYYKNNSNINNINQFKM